MSMPEDEVMQSYEVDGEVAICPSCSSSKIRHLDFVRGRVPRQKDKYFRFVTGCGDCGGIFVNPSPDTDTLYEYYSAEGGWNEKKGYEELDGQDWAVRLVDDKSIGKSNVHTIVGHARNVFGADLTGRSLLDFGCGRGQLLDKLAPFGLRTFGLDPATTGMVTRHRMLTEIPSEPTFDIISAIHVFEHIPAPLQVFKQLRSALREGGIFVCGMPALDGLREHRQKRYVANKDQHISIYTRLSLKALLAKAGLQTVAFYPGIKPYRFRCAAVWSNKPEPVSDPLKDAEAEFRGYRETEPEWRPEMARLSIRELVYLENERHGQDLLLAKQENRKVPIKKTLTNQRPGRPQHKDA